ncbi:MULTISPECIES: SDR family oxidoreductase [unclassified Microcoleus]|uniref:SDR family oxidoreductase n=1 Tax=unclassified Microcoleus TaxID=2642155 RepID=UPI002FD53D87
MVAPVEESDAPVERPFRRIATLEEVAATVCFLADPDADKSSLLITGETLMVDGGFVAQ